jgi:ATP-dependent helicase HrpA
VSVPRERALPEAPLAALRERLPALTLRDRHRLERRFERLRRKPDADALARLVTALEEAEARVAARRAAVPAISYPEELPVSAHRDELRAALEANQVVVVAGETGSGKTTQLPKLCLELGRGIRAGSPPAPSRSGSPTSSTCRSAAPSATPCASTTAPARTRSCG